MLGKRGRGERRREGKGKKVLWLIVLRLAAVGLVLAVAVDVAGFWLLGVLSGVCSLFVGSVTWVAVAGWTVNG